jgi:hypothetical protein
LDQFVPYGIDYRINRNQAELRRVVRFLATRTSPEHADQLRDRREQLTDQIGFDKQKLAAAGAISYGKHNVHAGDLINAVGRWLPVVRANVKTATVPTGYSWTDTLPWSKVRGVVKAEDFTPDQVQQMLDAAGDDKHRSAALAKTRGRAEQAATHHPAEDTTTARLTPAPGETDELPLDLAADVDAEPAGQRLHQQQRTGHPPTGAAAPTAGARGWAR